MVRISTELRSTTRGRARMNQRIVGLAERGETFRRSVSAGAQGPGSRILFGSRLRMPSTSVIEATRPK